ncbi:transglycosylase domain-containing protein [Candidatus Uhrbacteria bacterium]|nr:transglycosylase domain-containing protein [Candidatus Uhrbacteria bacterium]
MVKQLFRVLRVSAIIGVVCGVSVACVGAGFAIAIVRRALSELPSPDAIAHASLPEDALVLDRDGFELAALPIGGEHRRIIPIGALPMTMRDAIVASEDARFWSHRGFDPYGILRAAAANVLHGRTVQGGSTITQQLLKLTLLRGRPSLVRKVEELLLATRFESLRTKEELLMLYANAIPLGASSSGVEAAARTYFGRSSRALTLAESALLVGMIPAPSATSPFCASDTARTRQRRVLQRMAATGAVTREEADAAARAPLTFRTADALPERGATASAVDAVLRSALPVSGERIVSTIDRSLQVATHRALRHRLEHYARRRGEHRGPRFVLGPSCTSWGDDLRAFRALLAAWGMVGPYVYDLRNIRVTNGCPPIPCRFGADILRRALPNGMATGIVTRVGRTHATVDLGDFTGTLDAQSVVWMRQPLAVVAPVGAVVDVRLPASLPPVGGTITVELVPRPMVEGAVVVMDPRTRNVFALIGGVDAHRGELHRALHARRPIGSTVKPFVFAAAIQNGALHPEGEIHDVPITYVDPWTLVPWSPANWYLGHRGPMLVTDAIAQSVNMGAIEATFTVGAHTVAAFLEAADIPRPIPHTPAIALGAFDLTPLDLTNAYAVFASGGRFGSPRLIRGADADTEVGRLVMEPEIVATVDTLLTMPVEHPKGTARLLRRLGLGIRGKTGTTNGPNDAWFVGYTRELLVAVWVGYDQPRSLHTGDREESGGSLAVPIAADVFSAAQRIGFVHAEVTR